MAGFLFQWIRGFFKSQSRKKKTGGRAFKPARRAVHLRLEPLEERVLMTGNAWLPLRLDPVGGIGQKNLSLQLFQPASTAVEPQLGLSAGSISLAGSFSLTDTGSYFLNLQEAGSAANSSFTFTESGTVTFSLSELGALAPAGYSVTSLSLTQTASLTWSLVFTSSMGPPMPGSSGHESLTTTSLGTQVLDAFFWDGLNWTDPTKKIIQDNNLSLVNGASSLTVNETAGTESYLFRIQNGLQSLSGTGGQPLPGIVQSGQETYSIALSSNFSFTNQGADTFTLYEQGNPTPSAFALSSVAYNETAHPGAGQTLGFGTQLAATGTITETGTASQTNGQGGTAATQPFGQTANQSFQLSDNLTYSYSENTSGGSYTLAETGTYGSGSFSLGAVAFSAQGAGSYALSLAGTEAASGTFTGSQFTTALADNLGNASSRTAAGSFSSSTPLSHAESGQGSFALTDQGSYAGGSFGFSNASLTESGSATFSHQQLNSYQDTAAGTTTLANAAQNLSASGTFTGQDSSTDSVTQQGSLTYSLTQAGAAGGGSYSLSCYVLGTTQTGSYSERLTSASVQTGTSVSLQSSTTPATSSVGFSSTAATTTTTYSTTSSSTFLDAGTFGQSAYRAGTYGAGSFALASTVFHQTTADNWSITGSDSTVSSGTSITTRQGNSQGLGAGGAGLASNSFTDTSSSAFAGTAADTYALAGSDTSSSHQYGTFAGNSFAFGSVVFSSTDSQSGTTQAAGADTFTTTTTDTAASWANRGPIDFSGSSPTTGLGSFSSTSQTNAAQAGNDAWTQTTASTSSSTLYEACAYALGSYSLSSVSYAQTAAANWTGLQTDASADTGTSTAAAAGAGSANNGFSSGSYGQSSSGVFADSSTATISQAGSDSSSESLQGTYANNSFSFASVVFQAAGSQTSSTQSIGTSTSSSTSALAYTSSSGLAGAGSLSTTGGTMASTRSGQDAIHQTGSDAFTQTAASSSSSTLYEAGSFSLNSFALSSVSYTETDSSSSSTQDIQAANDSGTDSSSTSCATTFGTGTAAQVTQGVTATGGSLAASNYSDAFQDASTSSSTQSTASTSTLSEQGVFASGSFAFSQWAYDAAGAQNGSTTASSTGTSTGAGSDQSLASGSAVTAGGIGIANTTLTSYSSSADTYSQTATQSSTQTTATTAGFSLHEAGSFALGSYSLSSVAYSTTAADSQALVQIDTAADTGTDSSSSGLATTQSGSLPSPDPANLSFTGQSASSSTSTVTDSYSDQSGDTITMAGSAAYSLTEQGAYAAGGFSFPSLVYQSSSATTGSLQSFASDTYSSTTTQAQTAASTGSSSFANPQGPGAGSSQNTSSSSAATTSYQAGADNFQAVEAVAATESQYEAGSFTAGVYAFASVVLASTSTDNLTLVQLSSSTQSGTDASANTLTTTATSSALSGNTASSSTTGSASSTSGAFTESSAITYSQTAATSSSLSQRGSYAGGSYAFSSVVFQSQTNGASTYAEADAGAFTATTADSSLSLATTTSTGASLNSFSLPGPSGSSTPAPTSSFQYASSQAATDSFTATGSTATLSLDYQTSSSSLYEAGSLTQGTYSLSSVVQTDANTESSSVQQTNTTTQTGTSATTATLTNSGTSAATGFSSSGAQATTQNSTETFSETSTTTLTQASSSTSSSVQQGTYAGGSYSFSSVVFQSTQAGQVDSAASGTQTFSTTSANGAGQSSTSAEGTVSNATSKSQFATDVRSGLNNLSAADHGTSNSFYYAAGSYDGAAKDYSLTSVTYQDSSSDNSSFTQTGSSTETITKSTQSSTAGASQGSNQTSVTNDVQTREQTGSSFANFSEQGTYANGSYAFSSVVYQDSSSTDSSTDDSSTTSATLTSFGTGLPPATSRPSTQLTPGQTLSNNSSTLYQNGTTSTTDDASSTSDLYEAGSVANGAYALSSLTYDQDSAETFTSLSTSLSTEYGNQTSNSNSSDGGTTAITAYNSATSIDNVYSSLNSFSSSSLHEEGNTTPSGQLSLSCVQYDGAGAAVFSSREDQAVTSVNTTANAFTPPSQSNGPRTYSSQQFNGSTNAIGTSVSTQLTGASSSYTLLEQGTYAAGDYSLSTLIFEEGASSSQLLTASSASNATVTNTDTGNTGNENRTDSLYSFQSTSVDLYEFGQYGAGAYSLSSFSLTAHSSQLSAETIQQNGTDTVTASTSMAGIAGWNSDLAQAIAQSLGSTQETVTGGGHNALTQNLSQTQTGTLVEEGTYSGGSFTLSLISLTVGGNYDFVYNRANNSQYTGAAAGSDNTTVAAAAGGTYNLTAQGSSDPNGLAFPSVTFTGSSAAGFALSQNGSAAGVAYSHSDSWVESTTVAETGTYRSGSPASSSGGALPQGWSFSSYSSAQNSSEVMSDQVGSSAATLTITDQVTVTGTGQSGTSTRTGQGNYNWNGRGYSFGPYTQTATVTLTGPTLPGFTFTAGTTEWMGGQKGTAGVTGGLKAAAGKLAGGAAGGKSGGPAVGVALGNSHAMIAPPTPGVGTPLPFGGWVGPQGPNLIGGPLAGLSQLQVTLWGLVNQGYQDGVQKAQGSKQLNPLSMYATAAWQLAVNNLPEGVEISQDFWAWLGSVWDGVAGVLDTVTFGLTGRLRSAAGLDFLVDTSSAVYQAGCYVGLAINIVLTFTTPAGILGIAIQVAQVTGGLLNVFDAFQRGDVAGGFLGLVGVMLIGARGLTSCTAGQTLFKFLSPTMGPSVAGVVGNLASWGLRGLGVIGAANSVGNAVTAFGNGDVLGGLLSLGQGAADLFNASKACFTAEQKVWTKRGFVRWDELTDKDEVAASNENDPFGRIEFKPVLEVYHFPPARIWHVHAEGKVIRTTAEHPFFVWGKGWIPALGLEAGDRFRSHNGQTVTVDEVFDSEIEEPVYNCAVAAYHTYFIGDEGWGFSVWAHNKCGGENTKAAKGRQEHADFKAKVKAKPGWTSEPQNLIDPKTGKKVVPDALDPKGRPVELKPDTPSGRRAGATQIAKYERATGMPGRVVYYKP